MCLAIPMKLVSTDGKRGVVDQAGVRREVGLDLLPDARIGDYLLIHAGFAIQIIDEQEAAETLQLFRQLAECSYPDNGETPAT